VKLYSRPGNDLTERFPLIVEAPTRRAIKQLETVAANADEAEAV
jgi:hypothetical protein